jgi:hypothetical protein
VRRQRRAGLLPSERSGHGPKGLEPQETRTTTRPGPLSVTAQSNRHDDPPLAPGFTEEQVAGCTVGQGDLKAQLRGRPGGGGEQQ